MTRACIAQGMIGRVAAIQDSVRVIRPATSCCAVSCPRPVSSPEASSARTRYRYEESACRSNERVPPLNRAARPPPGCAQPRGLVMAHFFRTRNALLERDPEGHTQLVRDALRFGHHRRCNGAAERILKDA